MIKKNIQIFLALCEAAVISIVSLLMYLSQDINSSKTLYIPKGSTAKIITYLSDNSISVSKLDSISIKFFGMVQSGWIDIGETKLTRADFLYKITHSKAAMKQITLIPGETKEIFFEQAAKEFDFDLKKLHNEYNSSVTYGDGIIFADTYNLPMGIKEDAFIKFLISSSLKRHEQISNELLNNYNEKEWFTKYITMACVIQKEAADIDEMPLVSAVIQNRLKIGMKLQMDGTLNYGKYSHVKVTRDRILTDESQFNTYKITGLPPRPFCAVDKNAIKAAIKPAKVKYLYFVKSKNGKHNFSNSYKTHLKNIRSVK